MTRGYEIMIKDFAKKITPPVLWSMGRGLASLAHTSTGSSTTEPRLFDGEDELFIDVVSSARVYGEYGMGTSTRWVARNTGASILAVDTSDDWVNTTKSALSANDRHHLEWVDVGPVGDWGMPLDFSKRSAFRTYVGALWVRQTGPDVVLIDGRFRLACWFESMINATPGTRLIFDDYVERRAYHVVEEYLKPERINTRQALFVVPKWVNVDALAYERDAFLMVRR